MRNWLLVLSVLALSMKDVNTTRPSRYCRLTKALEKKFEEIDEKLKLVEAGLGNIDTEQDVQNDRLDGIDAELLTRSSRLDDIEAGQIEQNGRLDAIDADQITQDVRLDDIDAELLLRSGRLDDIEAGQIEQNGRLDAIDAGQITQDSRLNGIDAGQMVQDGRLNVIEAALLGQLGDESYAFYTHFVTDTSPSVGDTLMFGTVQYNEAGVYNIVTGRYTAPIDGIYRFDATLCTKTLRQLSAEFYMEGSVDQQIGIVKSSSTCSSDHAIAELAAGDEVFLRAIDKSGIGNLIQRDDERRNSFTGHYLGPSPTFS